MHSISSKVAANRPRRRRFGFRAFYITVLFISAFAVISFITDQRAKYKYGPQYGLALEELDSRRLMKRDEEVSDPSTSLEVINLIQNL
jgi:hypothetical protein